MHFKGEFPPALSLYAKLSWLAAGSSDGTDVSWVLNKQKQVYVP